MANTTKLALEASLKELLRTKPIDRITINDLTEHCGISRMTFYSVSYTHLLGIEFGSTRIKAVLTDANHTPIASGSHEWENRLDHGIWTYTMDDIWGGLQDCYRDLKKDVKEQYGVTLTKISAIGFSAMMHGYLAFDKAGELLVPFRTWRNTITEEAAAALTKEFSYNIPQRWSIAHLYQAMLNKEEHVKDIAFFTTLAGFIHWKLTGEKVLGVGDASGMFPKMCIRDRLLVGKMFGDYGIVNSICSKTGLTDLLRQIGLVGKGLSYIPFLTKPGWAHVMIVLINIWVGVPFQMLSATGILMNIPHEQMESAKIDGANERQIFWKITMPYMLFVTGPSLLTALIANINNFNVIYLLTTDYVTSNMNYANSNAKEVDLLVTWLFRLTNDYSNYKMASVIGICVFCICAVLTLIGFTRMIAGNKDCLLYTSPWKGSTRSPENIQGKESDHLRGRRLHEALWVPSESRRLFKGSRYGSKTV